MGMTAAGRAFYRPMAPNQIQALRKRIARAALPASEKRLLQLVYRRYSHRTGACQRHLVTLAKELRLTVRHTFRLIRAAAQHGFLEFESTGRRRRNQRWEPALYRFRPPAPPGRQRAPSWRSIWVQRPPRADRRHRA